MPRTGSPTVEMLWESCDSAEALARRFGFADGGTAQDWLSTVVSEHWGIDVSACRRIVMSDHNALAWLTTSDGELVAKWSVARGRFARLSELADLTQWLAGRGSPVSALVPTLDGSSSLEGSGALLVLQRVIEGDPLDVAHPGQVAAAGAVLARLHDDLARYPALDRLRRVSPTGGSLRERVTRWLDSEPPHVPAPLLATVRGLVSDAPTAPMPTQLLHGDFRAANVLCSGTDVLAVIDFDEATFDHPVTELARSAVLLGTLFHDWGPVSAQVRTEFLAGYESVRRLDAAEARWWDALVGWYSLAMVPADPAHDTTGWLAAARAHLETAARGPAT
ncbi:phosphotransferase [Isoptericola sp. NEAU-Y5]|uniref:Phosphotransferase n=1 Tax=Isoptericola luteus TaxID=2879484 RepID=A0ABS7ZGK8_9MICO|nr:phosphotransferase [Isoptericola sp. NEAU-Y5]MCA5894166.1 phosphotransferase [Isoptericola sp. NEAU-Y5]